MAKKKQNTKPAVQEEKPKPIDRTQVIVAIIGLIGTITVALIALLANKSAEPAPNTHAETFTVLPNTAEVNMPVTSTSEVVGGLCLEEYFSNIAAQNRLDLDAGVSTRISTSRDGSYGIRFFDNGKLLGEMKFTGATNTKSFHVVSLIDVNCQQIFSYGNLDRPTAKGTIGDWENLGLSFTAGNYRLRMGWYGGNQISLNFSSNE